ncbi:MAG: inner membrane CreD family protein [Saprospiraceae bacterium]|nr:inner membrane CreD family protein [Saprospiraceae bacterium]
MYGFIFILIQLQDWALLIGSVGLFVVLTAVMYFSKRINFEKAEL